MCKKLHEKSIAHGDLQHGNILVDSNGNIYLIDYDSMFVPSLEKERDIIKGRMITNTLIVKRTNMPTAN